MTHIIKVLDLQEMLLPIDRHRPVDVCIESGPESDWCLFIDKVEYRNGRARLICIPDGELKTSNEEELDARCDELIAAQKRMLEMLERFNNVMLLCDPVDRSTQLAMVHNEVKAEHCYCQTK